MPSYTDFIRLTDLAGLAGVTSATAACLLLLPGPSAALRAGFSKPRMALLLAAMFALMLIPFGAIPLAGYIRGATGDLSITTLVLVWSALLRPWCGAVEVKHRRALLLLIAAAALALYPMALGLSANDPYRLGYGNPLFLAVLLLLALAAWWRSHALVTLCLALAVLAWAIGWYESGNLWDYLIDPFVSIYALTVVARHAIKCLVMWHFSG